MTVIRHTRLNGEKTRHKMTGLSKDNYHYLCETNYSVINDFNRATLSVFSHGNSISVRPK